MQTSFVCLLAAFAVLASVQAAQTDTPAPLKADVDIILKNKDMFDSYVKCVMDQSPCSEDGALVKERLPMRLNTKCEGCTDDIKERTTKVVKYLKDNQKTVWEDFKKKYDPENKWNEEEWIH